MPWQADGRRWHTRDRVGLYGIPIRWDGRILERVVDLIDEIGEFDPPDWSHRSVVVIGGAGPVPFFEAITGDEWAVTLKFRVFKGQIKPASLAKQLDLPRSG